MINQEYKEALAFVREGSSRKERFMRYWENILAPHNALGTWVIVDIVYLAYRLVIG